MLRQKQDSYYQGVREDIVELVPEGAKCILDVGCASGITGERLKKRGASEVVGIERERNAYDEAKRRLDKVLLGDVEKIRLPFKKGSFDCIIYADILEHLIDPWSILRSQRALLKDGGSVVASIPNIGHYRVIKKLKKQRWDYQERGVLDSTHLRFFTLDGIKRMFSDAGYGIDRIVYKISASRIKKTANRILGGRMNESLSEQFLIRAKKI